MQTDSSNNTAVHAPQTFKSAVGLWYYAIVIVVIVITGVAFYPALSEPGWAMVFPFTVTVLFGCGLPVWLLYATDYTVTDSQLLVRSGPFKWRIKRSDIRDITPTRNPLASPALSLDRLKVSYGNHGFVLVSPKDKPGFYRALGFTPPPGL